MQGRTRRLIYGYERGASVRRRRKRRQGPRSRPAPGTAGTDPAPHTDPTTHLLPPPSRRRQTGPRGRCQTPGAVRSWPRSPRCLKKGVGFLSGVPIPAGCVQWRPQTGGITPGRRDLWSVLTFHPQTPPTTDTPIPTSHSHHSPRAAFYTISYIG